MTDIKPILGPYGQPLTDLSDELKEPICKFCQELSTHILKTHKARTIVINYNDDKVSIGKDNKGGYLPCYYDPNQTQDQNIQKIVNNNTDTIKDCKDYIDQIHPTNKLRSFNIFYNCKNGKINVCLNAIGNKSIAKSRLFHEFIYSIH